MENEFFIERFAVKNIPLDRAGKNIMSITKEFCIKNGVELRLSPAYESESSRAAERMIQDHWARTRVMLKVELLPSFL